MENNNIKLKLFISYCHSDEEQVMEFIKHLAPLKTKGVIDEWYDRKIIAGKEFQDHISNKLENADIICLAISANFLASNACMKEKINAIKLMKSKGIVVVPIILFPCGWLDDEQVCKLLALPNDGKPITTYSDKSSYWNDVYNGLKKVIEDIITIKQLEISPEFLVVLQNIELLSKAHAQKESVHLDDIFIYPEMTKYDDLGEYEKIIKSDVLLEEYENRLKIVIAGEDQSGKTTLCKKLFLELKNRNFVPVYIQDKTGKLEGKIENKILAAFNQQYVNAALDKFDKKRIVPIIDDFHLANKKEERIQDLSPFHNQIIIVDDIFCLNFKDDKIIKSFSQFKIREFKPSYRDKLIKKWAHLSDKAFSTEDATNNKLYQAIDKNTELVNSALGKVIGSGIMPSYPFFILSVISTYETLEKPIDQEITSQGYCYQALIYMYLRKQGVKNDEIDTYINFLSEFAFYFYKERKIELITNDFDKFMKLYVESYNLTIGQDVIVEILRNTQIINLDSFNNYSFNYPYLYYFFVAKYLDEHSEENKAVIESIVANLHKDENAYIAIFISHHSKNIDFLEDIILNSMFLFDKYKPATLCKDDLRFFDKQVSIIVEAALPPVDSTPEKERAKRLERQDLSENIESKHHNGLKNSSVIKNEEEDDELSKELRRSIKTVEVMGQIIKNRSGSLKKDNLENIFEQAMKTNLRILTSFIEVIEGESSQKEIVSYIKARLEKHNLEILEGKKGQEKPKKPSREQLEKLSEDIFWNINFTVVYGFINKIVHSLGSNNLIAIAEKVCNKENTPATFLIKHGIFMWYNKNLQVENIASEIEKESFSEIAKKVMKYMIVNHCAIHTVNYKDNQRIENRIGISVQKLLTNKLRNENS
jgi:TIR domain.